LLEDLQALIAEERLRETGAKYFDEEKAYSLTFVMISHRLKHTRLT
jgi:hypothetical protein